MIDNFGQDLSDIGAQGLKDQKQALREQLKQAREENSQRKLDDVKKAKE